MAYTGPVVPVHSISRPLCADRVTVLPVTAVSLPQVSHQMPEPCSCAPSAEVVPVARSHPLWSTVLLRMVENVTRFASVVPSETKRMAEVYCPCKGSQESYDEVQPATTKWLPPLPLYTPRMPFDEVRQPRMVTWLCASPVLAW